MKPELVEEWRPVVGYEGRYEVSNLGEVRSLPRTMKARHGGAPNGYHMKGRILKKNSTPNGYYFVPLGKGKRGLVHRLVLEAFVPNPDNKPCCDHIDANRHNNRVGNLRWATWQENNAHPHAVAMRSKPVLQIDKETGAIINRFNSVKEANEALKTSYVSKCCHGKQMTTAGYKWRFENETDNH
jgi:hypothetical protein